MKFSFDEMIYKLHGRCLNPSEISLIVSLMQAISKLRKVLGDQAKAPIFIETIPKKGYRLLPQVDSLETSPSLEATTNTVYVYRTVGSFTDFIEKLTQPKFLLAFLVFSICLIMVLAILSYMVFWI